MEMMNVGLGNMSSGEDDESEGDEVPRMGDQAKVQAKGTEMRQTAVRMIVTAQAPPVVRLRGVRIYVDAIRRFSPSIFWHGMRSVIAGAWQTGSNSNAFYLGMFTPQG